MTAISDVVRQVETAMNDPLCPPDPEEREVLATILSRMNAGIPSDVY
jgi:hypothetical protein